MVGLCSQKVGKGLNIQVLTGSAVAILQICGRKVSVHWTELRNVTSRCAHAPCGVTGRRHPPDGGMASTEARRECETEGCGSDAKLQCPTCIKLGIQGSYFCSQVPLCLPSIRPKGRWSLQPGPWRRSAASVHASCRVGGS